MSKITIELEEIGANEWKCEIDIDDGENQEEYQFIGELYPTMEKAGGKISHSLYGPRLSRLDEDELL